MSLWDDLTPVAWRGVPHFSEMEIGHERTNPTMSKKVSVYNGVKDNVGVSVDINTVVERIKSGDKGLREKTERLNTLYVSDRVTYDVEKMELPAVTWSGTFPEGERKGDALVQHSAYVVLDIDNNVDLVTVRADLSVHPNVSFAFVSPSDTGIKPLIKVSPVPMSVAEHHAAFDAVLEVFRDYVDQDPTKLPAQRDPNRLCFLAYDPNPIMNAEAAPVPWELPALLPVPEQSSASDHSPPSVQEAYETLKLLDASDYPRWIEIGMAIKSAGLPLSVWDDWSKSASNYEPGACEKKWVSFKSAGVNWGSVVHRSLEAQGKKPNKKDKGDSVPESPYFEKSRFIPTALMDDLDADFSFLALPTEKYLRVYKDGVYSLVTDGSLSRVIHKRLGSRLQAKYVNETLELLRQRHLVGLPGDGHMPCSHPEVVNLRNGLYDIRKRELRPHTPKFKSLVQLPVAYDDTAESPEIDAYLADVFRGRDTGEITLAHEIIGYSMLMQLPIAKLFVLLGPTHTGKSTFLDIIKAFLGAENTSGVSLQALDDDMQRFARSGLYGKLANIAADLSSRALAGDSKVKMIAAGDSFDVERKGIDSFSMRPFATLICAANEMPKSRDRSDAWLERITILPFVNQHKGDAADRDLLRKLTTAKELSGLLNYGIRSVGEVLKMGVFTESEAVKDAREEYGLMNDYVLRFLTENFLRQAESLYKDEEPKRLLESDVFTAYVEWSVDENIKPTTKANFRDSVEKWAGEKRVRAGSGRDDSRAFVFQKIIMVEGSDDAIDF